MSHNLDYTLCINNHYPKNIYIYIYKNLKRLYWYRYLCIKHNLNSYLHKKYNFSCTVDNISFQFHYNNNLFNIYTLQILIYQYHSLNILNNQISNQSKKHKIIHIANKSYLQKCYKNILIYIDNYLQFICSNHYLSKLNNYYFSYSKSHTNHHILYKFYLYRINSDNNSICIYKNYLRLCLDLDLCTQYNFFLLKHILSNFRYNYSKIQQKNLQINFINTHKKEYLLNQIKDCKQCNFKKIESKINIFMGKQDFDVRGLLKQLLCLI